MNVVHLVCCCSLSLSLSPRFCFSVVVLVVYCSCSSFSGMEHVSGSTASGSKPIEPSIPFSRQAQRDYDGTLNHQPGYVPNVCDYLD